MNAKNKKTLAAIFAKQSPKAMHFRDIESLLKAIGCETFEGAGSRVLFSKDNLDWPTHRPHPQKTARSYHLKEVREYLRKLGVEP